MENLKNGCPDVVITSGGTQERIDDVRYIGNFSGGRLGRAMAESYAQLGHQVLLLAPNSVAERFGIPDGVEHRSFSSAQSLEEAIHEIPEAKLVLQAAAVSDYTPERCEGKISSDQEELVIRLKRNPKILKGLRQHFGEQTQIVGFKLLSSVSENELIDVAQTQISNCQTDACIANDLQDIKETRKIHIVKPDGSYQTISGDTEEVAFQISTALPVRGA